MNATVAQLTARSLLGRRRTLLLLSLPAVLVALAVAVRVLADVDQATSVALLGSFALGTVVPLLGLIVGSGAIGPEIDDGSILYLLAKPLSRQTIVTSKLLVAVAVVVVVAALPTFGAGLVLAGSADGVAVAYGVGAAVAGTAYCALFLLLGVVSRNAVVVGLVYAVLWESLIGGFVPGAQALSIQQWSLALTERLLGGSAAELGVSSAVGLGPAIVGLLVVTGGGALYAGHRLRSLRVTSDE